MRGVSLKQRLVLSFLAIAVLAAGLSSGVYYYFISESFKSELSNKAETDATTGRTQIKDRIKDLETHANVIASDSEFGQVLSFDSPEGISARIKHHSQEIGADLVLFVPRPAQYVSIKYTVFARQLIQKKPVRVNPELRREARTWALRKGYLKSRPPEKESGWIFLEGVPHIFAARPVRHFGNNMGVALVANRVDHAWAEQLSKGVGADLLAIDPAKENAEERLLATSLDAGPEALFQFLNSQSYLPGTHSEDIVKLGARRFIPNFEEQPIQTPSGQSALSVGFLVSIEEMLKAQRETLKKVAVGAAAVTLLAALIGFFVARAISNPLLTMTRVIQSISQTRDLGQRVSGQYSAEIGILATSFNGLVEELQVATEKLEASERRMKEELTMASTVQELLFPEREFASQNLEISSFIQSSSETGGDWYDYFTTEDGHYTLVLVGDVTGHGMPAALITAIMTGFAESIKRSGMDLRCDRILEELNAVLISSAGGKLHMTFFVSIFDHRRGELRYANGGHNRPFVCQTKPDGGTAVTTLASAPSQRLGESLEAKFVEESVALGQGDVVLFYTDGLLECTNPKGTAYGKRRVMNLLKEQGTHSAQTIKETLVKDAFGYFQEHPLADDITLVVVRLTGAIGQS